MIPGIAGRRCAQNFAKLFGRHRILGELERQQQTERRGKTVMTQHHQIEKTAEHLLARRCPLCVETQCLPRLRLSVCFAAVKPRSLVLRS
jgi:hypothetical protein